MRKIVGVVVLLVLCMYGGFAQSATTGSRVQNILYVYEENNENLDPWIEIFENELDARDCTFDATAVSEINTYNLSTYDYIIINGAVMAFTAKEPIRDWLRKKPDLSGKNVALFVTANRWFLGKYFNQLRELLNERNANTVDAVSTATKDLNDSEKKALVSGHIQNILKK